MSRLRTAFLTGVSLFALATLDLNFVDDVGRLNGVTSSSTSLLTVTRASDGYAQDTAGAWALFGPNVARRTNRGLLVEEARTNSIRNNSMQGAVAGVIGGGGALPTNWSWGGGTGITLEVVAIGTENGIDYLDLKLSGTTGSGSFGLRPEAAADQIAASSGQVRTYSAFTALRAGSIANITSIQQNTSGYTAGGATNADGALSADIKGSLPTSLNAASRSNVVITLADATTAFVRPQLLLVYNTSVAIDITLRIGWPQEELGSFSTSPIRTTSAAATRAADVISVTTPPAFGAAHSLFIDATPPTYNVVNQIAVQISITNADRIRLMRFAGGAAGGEVTVASATLGSPTTGVAWTTSGKLAGAFATNDQAVSLNGSAVGTTAVAIFTPTTFHLGQNGGGGSPLNGYIRRVAYWPTRLSNAQLQAITA
jgi:hypothetical protein